LSGKKKSQNIKVFFFFLIKTSIYSGVNKSDVADYPRVPEQCAFFNNKFLIFSSLGSFFIPCIIIFAIYYRIFMVIMARARKNRKQWRPKAAIESAAAQHRTNANHLLTTFLQDRLDTNSPTITNTTSKLPNEPPMIINESVPLTNNPDRNVLMLQSPALRASINVTSSSGEQLDDDERDDIALFVHHEQQQNYKNNKDNQIEILPSTTVTSNIKFDNSKHFKTKTCSSQTENHHHSHYSTKRFKTRLKAKTCSDGLPIKTSAIQANNNTKIAKRKVYSRMKKERKATQTLVIVLSMTFNIYF
jgi:hypothetical protein